MKLGTITFALISTILVAGCGNIDSLGGIGGTSGTGDELDDFDDRWSVGGASLGGSPGTARATLGGSPGVAGSSASGGATAEPLDPLELPEACELYCQGYATVCPQAGFGSVASCTANCLDGLSAATPACIAGKRETLACIGNAMLRTTNSCLQALAVAEDECGNADARVPACNETACTESIQGDSLGCTAAAACDNGDAVLTCTETRTGSPTCTCTLNGVVEFETSTGFSNSKSACTDADLFGLCKSLLP